MLQASRLHADQPSGNKPFETLQSWFAPLRENSNSNSKSSFYKDRRERGVGDGERQSERDRERDRETDRERESLREYSRLSCVVLSMNG